MVSALDTSLFALGVAVCLLGLLPGVELRFRVIISPLRLAKPPALAEAKAWLASPAGPFDAWPGSHRTRSILLVPNSNIA